MGGETRTSLSNDEIKHHLEGDAVSKNEDGASNLLTHLRSKWVIKALEMEREGAEKTSVTLSLEFAFANPMYTALSAGAAPKVADYMIKAFEEQVKSVLEK